MMIKLFRFIRGLALIVICYYIGEFLSLQIGGFISPSVMGMLILFALLQFKILKTTWIEKASDFLLDNLVLFFVPATAGVALIPFAIIKDDALTVIIASIISSVLVLIVVGKITDKFENNHEKRGHN
jgi:holin-like protein